MASSPSATDSPPSPSSSSDRNNGGSGTGTGTGTAAASSSPSKSIAIDPRLPAGGVQLITPAPLAVPQYYKIGDKLTFGWNYTSLSVTPSAIDIMASCSLNNNLYTIALNQSLQPSQAVTWDTGAEATASVPLAMASYTLVIYDATKGVSGTPSPGYLATFNQFQFAMYAPKQYTPASDYRCASCSGAVMGVALDAHALGFMLAMFGITVVSFTTFVVGAGGLC
ncbi:MAG: hypothetical protein M1826_001917 [Phylliscum demangeonii]|nr:MAG: hypothetical protein M1826_001917 [Phylliscum demangeonii]